MLALFPQQTGKTSWTCVFFLRAPENSLQIIFHRLFELMIFPVTPYSFSYALLIKWTHAFMLNSLFEFFYIQHFKRLQLAVFEWVWGVVRYFLNWYVILFEYFLDIVIISDWGNVEYGSASDWQRSADYLFLSYVTVFCLATVSLDLRQL